MNKQLNCPNCGAPITGLSCEYCGTQFYNIADMEVGKPGYLRMKLGNSVNFFKAFPTCVDIKTEPGELITLYQDNNPVNTFRYNPEITVTIELKVIEEEGVLLRKYVDNVKNEC